MENPDFTKKNHTDPRTLPLGELRAKSAKDRFNVCPSHQATR